MTKVLFDPNNPCLFCNPKDEEIIAENAHAQLIMDSFPVSDGHCLIVPKRHIATYFEATEKEHTAFFELIKKAESWVAEQGFLPDGFNIGSNNGIAAGQSVFHLHIHIIPRYTGDVENPRGGVRQVIPRKAAYNTQDRPA